jgi:hypothetical protein
MGIIQSIFLFFRAFIMGRAATAIENLALRQQTVRFSQTTERSSHHTSTHLPGIGIG